MRQFQHVVALERHRHFGRAADSLNMSQPALSRSILSLEKSLGAPLFQRSSPGLEPTARGSLVIKHGRRILAAVAELESELSLAQGRRDQSLSVACGHYPAELSVPGALSALMRSWPQAQVRMEVTDWVRIAALLESGACDLAVTELSASSTSIELATEQLNDRILYLVVRKDHPLLQVQGPELDDILSYPWVCSHIPARAAVLFGTEPVAAGDLDADNGRFIPKIIASSLSTAFRLVMSNDIIGVAPISLAYPHLERGDLVIVPYRAPWMRLNYGLMWNAQKPLSGVAQAFMNEVRAAEARLAERESAMQKALQV